MSALVKSRHVQRTSRCPLGAKSGHSSVRCVVHTTVPFSYAESDNLTEHLNCSRSKRAEPESQCLLRYHVVVNQAAHRWAQLPRAGHLVRASSHGGVVDRNRRLFRVSR
jgi:hypothetical protein